MRAAPAALLAVLLGGAAAPAQAADADPSAASSMGGLAAVDSAAPATPPRPRPVSSPPT